MHLPFQKVKKNIVWGMYTDWDNKKNKNKRKKNKYRQLTLFYLTNLYSAKKK